MWNAEGRTFYDDIKTDWEQAFDDDDTWDLLCRGWDEWMCKIWGQKHWRKNTKNPLCSRKDDENDAADSLSDRMSEETEKVFLPGDHGFEPRRLSSDC